VKSKTAKPSRRAPRNPRTQSTPRPNPQLNRQSRKVLGQHYRAKYGVK
jgi:hypothetical protein